MGRKKTKFVVVYGSLRKDEYNYDRFKRIFRNDFEYHTTKVIYGWDLFDLGAYPGVKKSSNPEALLMVDIMEVSEECFQALNAMELGAGYEAVEIDLRGKKGIIYEYMRGVDLSKLVPSGNWSNHVKAKERAEAAEKHAAYMRMQMMYDNQELWD